MIKRFLRKIAPKKVIDLYHLTLSKVADLVYGHPSNKLIVIGVTGTSGKSTTVSFIGQMLEYAGFRVGSTSTATIKVGTNERPNDSKMTSLGRFQTQKLLRQMVRAGCTHAIIETTSQGIVQYRHLGINYDVAVFTNLWSEHIEAHGSFERYKQAKLELFRHLTRRPHKRLGGQEIPKVIVVNGSDPHAKDFLACKADRKIAFEIDPEIEVTASGASFTALGVDMELNVPGKFNVENALAAASVAMVLGISVSTIASAVAHLHGAPGRFERIDEGQPFTVIVDYAFEPVAMKKMYETLSLMPHERLIQVLGSCGGGRDASRRPVLGRMAGEVADVVIVTNEDPYDDDPLQIIQEVAAGALAAGKVVDDDLLIVPDRGQAIHQAIQLAKPGDVVLVTGKGSEPVMAVARGKLIPWDDRTEARKALQARQTPL